MGNNYSIPDFSSINHLIIYVHGVGFNGHKHGIYLKEFIDNYNFNIKTQVYLTQANISLYSSYKTMYNTINGIKSGGDRLYNELKTILIDNPTSNNIKYISFIGSSMGGIYLRYLIKYLYNDLKHIQFYSFITLATPHLGISGLQLKISPWLLSHIQTGIDLQSNNNNNEQINIKSLCKEEYLNILKLFTYRVSYSPIYNDGIVPFVSSAISLYFPYNYPKESCLTSKELLVSNINKPLVFGNPLILEEEYKDSKDLDINDKLYYFNNSSDIIKDNIIQMQHQLIELKWNIIHISLDHRSLATLYKGYNTSTIILEHLIQYLEIDE